MTIRKIAVFTGNRAEYGLQFPILKAIDKHPELKDGFDMWQEDEADGRQRVAPAAIMSVMVKAVQELSTQVDELKAEIQTLKGE